MVARGLNPFAVAETPEWRTKKAAENALRMSQIKFDGTARSKRTPGTLYSSSGETDRF